MKRTCFVCLLLCLTTAFPGLLTSAYAQITPSADAYTNTADPTTNYGAATLLYVNGATEIAYIQFNLSSIPTGASVSQATLKLYVNAITTGGTFNIDYVTGTWNERTIKSNLAPALGAAIATSGTLATTSKNQYILINVTSAVQAWLSGSVANDGLALVANSTFNASFDSKENTTTSHPPEFDIVFAGRGTITGVTTASGSGLTGGGTNGTLNLSLLTTCSTNQVLAWSGSDWTCATASAGSIALSSITAPTRATSIATGTYPTTFTVGDFGSSPVASAFGITDTAVLTTDNSFDLTVKNGNNSYHHPFSAGVTTSGTYFPQLQICNNTLSGTGHVGASLFGNSVTCDTLSTAPYNKVTITDNTGSHTGLAILNKSSAETGTMLRLLSATATSGSYNFLTACAGTTAADGLCNGTIVAILTAPGALSVATSVTAPQFCIGSSCITSWPPAADRVTGITTAGSGLIGGGSFKIDHPLDPANKYLSHSFVESPDMKNIYDGVATLDERGSIWITLPDYFEALNQEFRYQLTSIARPQPSLYVAREISGNRFKISGGKPGGKVSWQVTGIRHDAYADAHRIQVEENKPEQEQGRYLHPELFGAPPEQVIGYQPPPVPTKNETTLASSLTAHPVPLR
jgi:hypothetical protein